jgi:hypothetical protein
MMIVPTLNQICCLIPCPIAFIVFAIPPFALFLRGGAGRAAMQIARGDELFGVFPQQGLRLHLAGARRSCERLKGELFSKLSEEHHEQMV